MGIELYVTSESIKIGEQELPLGIPNLTYRLRGFSDGERESMGRDKAFELAKKTDWYKAGWSNRGDYLPHIEKTEEDYIFEGYKPLPQFPTQKQLEEYKRWEIGRIPFSEINIPAYKKVLKISGADVLSYDKSGVGRRRKGSDNELSTLTSLANALNEVAPSGVLAEASERSEIDEHNSYSHYIEIYCTAEHSIVVRL
ncbi:hypothetical protein HYX14_05565 [Candidatus Woesearchaeota archaeon]|nr:hypothetical protein [Candidatus Woesearchaeota archaeon]